MVKSKEIINYINGLITIHDYPITKHGLCEVVSYEDKKRPREEDGIYVDFDGISKLTSYHKINNERITKVQGYGSNEKVRCETSITLVCFTFDEKTSLHSLAFYTSMLLHIGLVHSIEGLEKLEIFVTNINYLGYETLKNDFGLNKNDERVKAFTINYTVDATFNKDCIEFCCN